jgi:hypothetical protein
MTTWNAAMRRKGRLWLLILTLLVLLVVFYVRTHPLVFMETHAHCITPAGFCLHQYADEHNGHFPVHPQGYGNALLLMGEAPPPLRGKTVKG